MNPTRSERYPTPPDEVPVEPIDWPSRLSQTLLRIENHCPRSAYLYVKHAGASKSHEMDRGTLAHACAEQLMLERIMYEGAGGERAGQPEPYAIDLNLPADAQEEALSMQTGAMVDELRRRMQARIHISTEQADIARVCAFHIALALDVRPEDVLGIERKFVIDLPGGWEVSVKADLLSQPDEFGAQVDDYKTSLDIPAKSEWDTFQVKTAAVALLYGYPVEKVPCPRCGGTGADACPECDGAGKIEVRGERLESARHLHWVRGRELYPRRRPRQLGSGLHRNEHTWSRLELDEFYSDLAFAGERILERLESWKWPARKGSWCTQCAGRWECPIPVEMRGFAGGVVDKSHAGEMWALAQALKDQASDLENVVKLWSANEGVSVRMGDLEWSWQVSETRAVKRAGKATDWEGFRAAVEAATERGVPFSFDDWVRIQRRNEFKKMKVPTTEGEVPHDGSGAADAGDAEQQRDRRFGADAPF